MLYKCFMPKPVYGLGLSCLQAFHQLRMQWCYLEAGMAKMAFLLAVTFHQLCSTWNQVLRVFRAKRPQNATNTLCRACEDTLLESLKPRAFKTRILMACWALHFLQSVALGQCLQRGSCNIAEAMPGYFLALPGLVDPTVAMALLLSKMGFFLNF